MIFTIYRTMLQILYHERYVWMMIEDTDNVSSMYHCLQVPELFLSNMLLFFDVYMLLLWDNTKPLPLFRFFSKQEKDELSAWLQVLVGQRNSNVNVLIKICHVLRKVLSFCLMIGIGIGIEAIYVRYSMSVQKYEK